MYLFEKILIKYNTDKGIEFQGIFASKVNDYFLVFLIRVRIYIVQQNATQMNLYIPK